MYDVREGRRQWLPLQYSCLENPMDGGAWWAAVHGVVKSRTLLSNFTFTFHFHALEKEMTTHSSVLAWRIPETGEPGGLPSMGSHRVGHDWSDLAAAAAEKGERREVRKKEKERGEERGKRVDIIWIGVRKDGCHNFTLKLCRQAIYFYIVYSRKEHGKIWIWGDIFIYLFTF